MNVRFITLTILIYFAQASQAANSDPRLDQAKEILRTLIPTDSLVHLVSIDEALDILLDFAAGNSPEESIENTISILETYKARLPSYLNLLASLNQYPVFRAFFLGQEIISVLLGFKQSSTYLPLGNSELTVENTEAETQYLKELLKKYFDSNIIVLNDSPAIFENRLACLKNRIREEKSLKKPRPSKKSTLKQELEALRKSGIIREGTVVSLINKYTHNDQTDPVSLGFSLGYDSNSVYAFAANWSNGVNTFAWVDDFFTPEYNISWIVYPETMVSAKKKLAGYRFLLQIFKAIINKNFGT